MLRGLSSEEAQCGAGDEVTLEVEGVVDGGMSGEEALRRSGRLEALHLPFSSSHRLVRVLGAVVLAQPLLMARSHPKLTAGAGVGRQPIGHEHVRSIALLPQELAHEPEGCGFVPAWLHEHVQDLALAIDRSPQPQTLASDHDRHLVEVPLGAWPGTKPAEVASESWPEFEDPAPNRLIRHVEPALGQELLHVAVAQGEPEIEPDRVPDDLRWELMTSVGDRLHTPTLPLPSAIRVTKPP